MCSFLTVEKESNEILKHVRYLSPADLQLSVCVYSTYYLYYITSFCIDMSCCDVCQGLLVTSEKFHCSKKSTMACSKTFHGLCLPDYFLFFYGMFYGLSLENNSLRMHILQWLVAWCAVLKPCKVKIIPTQCYCLVRFR